MFPKDEDGLANSVNPDQTALSQAICSSDGSFSNSLLWVYTVCSSLPVNSKDPDQVLPNLGL